MAMTTDDGYELNTDKIDDTVLALLAITMRGDDRAWKCHDWDTLCRLHEKRMIRNPMGKAKPVALTSDGMKRCQELFDEMYIRPSQ